MAVLGKAGTLTGYLRSMGQVAKEERAAVGKTVNEVRNVVEAALEDRKSARLRRRQAAISAAAVDVTLPGRSQQVGTRHLINRITDEISEIFLGLGYTVAQGPEVKPIITTSKALNARPIAGRSTRSTWWTARARRRRCAANRRCCCARKPQACRCTSWSSKSRPSTSSRRAKCIAATLPTPATCRSLRRLRAWL